MTDQGVGGQPFGQEQPDVTRVPDVPDWMRGKTFTMSADITSGPGQSKVARFRHFEIKCDEPHWLGGEDEYPQPLTYVVAGIGFCLLTQVRRYATMLKIPITRSDCRVEMDLFQDGSVLAGTLHSGIRAFRIDMELESSAPRAKIAHVVDLAQRGCFAERLVETAIPIEHRYVLNGEQTALFEASVQ
jgi:uncharacterized OsmC-like protein